MTLYINSSRKDLPDDVNTVGKVIDHLQISRRGTGVAVNSQLVPAKEWDKKQLNEGDSLTVISAAYGG